MRLRDYFPDPERMTGRTTRMLARAAVAIARGEQVAVVVFGPERASITNMMERKGYYPRKVMIVSLDNLSLLQSYGPGLHVYFDHAAKDRLTRADLPMLDWLRAAAMIAE